MQTYDYIIVGAGSAGCVLAERLTASGRHKVLLIEAGGRGRSPWIALPLGYGKTFFHPTLNWRYSAEPEEALAVTVSGIPESVSGAADGSASLEISGGDAPYTVYWSNGATTPEIAGLPAGEYCAGVSDANDCVMEVCIELVWMPELGRVQVDQ